jgi:glycosyltransferase involved in cell wall biosynthesis
VTKRHVAIVTTWFGPDATGGAESAARELATRLAERERVTILTTTARSFHHDWSADYFRPGTTREGALEVRRFRLDPRDNDAFHRLNGKLLSTPRERWREVTANRIDTDPFIKHSINSTELENHLRKEAPSRYDAVAFIPYLHGVTVRGIEAYQGPAHLIPCLHDEVYARIPRIEDALHRAATLLFNSEGEAELALRLYGPGLLHKSVVMGEGIPPASAPAAKAPVEGPYFLYLGRRDATKGVDFLVDAFARYRENGGRPESTLVLAGPGEQSYAVNGGFVRDLGFVDEATKIALIRNAHALVQPSFNESYSRAIMEAWREEVPVIVQEACLATAMAVHSCGGGLAATDARDWGEAFAHLERLEGDARREMGRRGAAYARENADWDRVLERFRRAVGFDAPAPPARRGKRIDQVIETMAHGDAISNYACHLQDRFRALGYDSTIYAINVWRNADGRAERLEPYSLEASDAIVYHHSIRFDAPSALLKPAVRKALIYHNITPASFYQPYSPKFAGVLDEGRAQLRELLPAFNIAAGVSDYNAAELAALGGRSVRTVPIFVDFSRFDVTPPQHVFEQTRGTRWLSVGRVAPNKGLHDVIEAFELFLGIDEDATLTIVGAFDRLDPYFHKLRSMVRSLHLEGNVTFTGNVDEASLCGYYRSADVYVCLSEHEGFCAPLVEAMFFDLPIVARASSAIPETLGGAGLIVEPGTGPGEIAALVNELRSDESLRARVLAAQRARRDAFLDERVFPPVDALIEELV